MNSESPGTEFCAGALAVHASKPEIHPDSLLINGDLPCHCRKSGPSPAPYASGPDHPWPARPGIFEQSGYFEFIDRHQTVTNPPPPAGHMQTGVNFPAPHRLSATSSFQKKSQFAARQQALVARAFFIIRFQHSIQCLAVSLQNPFHRRMEKIMAHPFRIRDAHGVNIPGCLVRRIDSRGIFCILTRTLVPVHENPA